MLDKLAESYERIIRLADKAEQAGDLRTAVAAVREIRGSVETFARVGLAMAQVQPVQESQRVDLDNLIDAALRRRMDAVTPSLDAGHDPDDEVALGVIVNEDPPSTA